MYGLRWSEWNRKSQLVFKSRDFATKAARERFVAKLSEGGNLFEIQASSDPMDVVQCVGCSAELTIDPLSQTDNPMCSVCAAVES